MSSRIKVIIKTFEVLETLSRDNKLSLKEITDNVALPKPTVFRILYTLQSLGYVDQDNDSQAFELSSKFISFINGAKRGSDLITVAEPFMEQLRDEYKETVNLAKLVDNIPVYINILESNQPFRISDSIGDHASFHCTAIGKAILAFLPEKNRLKLLKNYSFTRFTKKTIMSVAHLKKELNKVANQGFAVDDEEGHDGVICISSPILDKDHVSFAAISISMPKVRAKKHVINKLKKELPEITHRISSELGAKDI